MRELEIREVEIGALAGIVLWNESKLIVFIVAIFKCF
jgi:hypothetical protein